MTLDDFKVRLETLGNGIAVDNENHFLLSVNRAMRRLYNDVIISKEARLAYRAPKPVSYHKEIHCKNGRFLEFPLVGTSYSMRFHGQGKYMITDGTVQNTYSVDSMNEAKVIKGFISFGGTISFWGSFSFTVYDFAVYDEFTTTHVADIPEEGRPKIFDLRTIYGDFMSFISPPTDSRGNPIGNCSLRDGKIELPPDFEGEILLHYRRLPNEVIVSDTAQNIDVPDEYLHLFSLLSAAYYWFYNDETLAQHYENLYKEGVESMTKTGYRLINSSYLDTNGWA